MRPNVLLVILDTVRARNTGLYGHDNKTTPFLSAFADQSTVYTQARAASIHSVASHASMWTGLHVPEHEITDHESNLDPEATVWTDLGDAGYETGLFTSNPVISHSSNLDDPFQTVVTPSFKQVDDRLFDDAFDPVDVAEYEGVTGNLKRAVRSERPVQAIANCVWRAYQNEAGTVATHQKGTGRDDVDEFLQWETGTSGPWAACINVLDAHTPYRPQERFDEWACDRINALYDETGSLKKQFVDADGQPWGELDAIESIYDGCIRQADWVVEYLVDELESRGLLDETMLIVTSDHGEGFGERSLVTPSCRAVTHSWGLHEVLTHVPLVVKYPNQREGEWVSEAASLTHLPDCIRSVVHGESAGPPESDPLTDTPVLASTERLRPEKTTVFDYPNIESFCGPWRAVYETDGNGVTKFATRGDPVIDAKTMTVYNAQMRVVDDYDERKDPSQQAIKKVKEAYGCLKTQSVNLGQSKIDRETEQRLQDLGYIR